MTSAKLSRASASSCKVHEVALTWNAHGNSGVEATKWVWIVMMLISGPHSVRAQAEVRAHVFVTARVCSIMS